MLRKVEGEVKGEGHGDGAGKFNGEAVPLRRWEDWERSRLRKIRREDRRRKDFERSHPSGYNPDGDLLGVRSQYDGSDAFSIASSEEDMWGGQVGGYNENNAQYPPPPVALVVPENDALQSAKTLGGAELEAMLNEGFDDPPSATHSPVSPYPRRYQLSENATSSTHLVDSGRDSNQSYSPGPMSRSASTHLSPEPVSPFASAADFRAHNDDRYGPLGPLDPSARF